ncbi:MAG: EamA family transporter [Cyanobacteria bacterium J06635_15]
METRSNAQRGARFGLLMVICSAILWGTVGVFVQTIYTLSETNPLSVGFFRLAISVPMLFLACLRTLGWQTFQIAKRDLGLMLLTGIMTAFYQVCYFASISAIGVAAATLVTLCTVPVWVALLAALILRERLTLGLLLAGICAVGGTALLVDLRPAQVMGRSHPVVGVVLALSSALGYAAVTLCSRALAKRNHPLQSLTFGFLAGVVCLFPIAWLNGLVLQYSPTSWLSLLYLGIVTTALAYLLYFSGMQYTPATVASIATLLEPLTATGLAWWLLGEDLGASGIVGGILLLIAIGMLYWENLR